MGAEKQYGKRDAEHCGKWHGWLLALCVLMLAGMTGAEAYAAEEREKIEEISLMIDSDIQSGSSSGAVYVSTGDSRFHAGSAEVLNEEDDWIGGMIPRVQVELYAEQGYYFGSTSRSTFTFTGDEASYVSARREDDQMTLVLTFKLDKLENGDLSVTGAQWDETDGTARWNENPHARYYHVRLYRNESSVTSIRTTYDHEYDFAGAITRKGDYYFEVRAVGGESERGDWQSSDSWYVSSAEADDISGGYDDDEPGEWNSWGSNGGPGVTGGGSPGPGGWSGGPGETGGGPGAAGNGSPGPGGWSSGPGGTGIGPGQSRGVVSGSGGHWCLDPYGWWFQYPDNSWPHDGWQCIDGSWYCFNSSGYIRYGWISWGDRWYYCGETGAMAVNARTPDGFYVGGDGVWIP